MTNYLCAADAADRNIITFIVLICLTTNTATTRQRRMTAEVQVSNVLHWHNYNICQLVPSQLKSKPNPTKTKFRVTSQKTVNITPMQIPNPNSTATIKP